MSANHAIVNRNLDNAISIALGIERAQGKAVDAAKATAAAIFDLYAPEDAETAQAAYAEERTFQRERLAKKVKNPSYNRAFTNALDQVRVFLLILAAPDHGVIVTKGGTPVRAEELVGNIANARLAAKAIADGDDGAERAKAPKAARGARHSTDKAAPKIDTAAASAQAFEGDMVKARAAFEAILGMQSGFGMVADVLKARGFLIVKAEATEAKAEAPKAEAPKAEAPKGKGKGKAATANV